MKSKPEKTTEPEVQKFDLDSIKPSNHAYVQYGSELVCTTPGHRHRQRIDPRKTLVQTEGGLALVET